MANEEKIAVVQEFLNFTDGCPHPPVTLWKGGPIGDWYYFGHQIDMFRWAFEYATMNNLNMHNPEEVKRLRERMEEESKKKYLINHPISTSLTSQEFLAEATKGRKIIHDAYEGTTTPSIS